ncbi:hypothetical protein AALO_G00282710 [Alosa alosa]|uniref:Uncharacterized protein n=1 Tax=Alosa alosa TaxID=278164 RepID=A0AAV6FPF7_9TELE|nr:hypothetical protein AALO_G00282710 [Alosa alosa]
MMLSERSAFCRRMERHRHMSEILSAEMTPFKDVAKSDNDLDPQAWVTVGVAKKVTELKDSVSYLRTVQRNVEQRLDAQEYTNAQLKKELSDWLKRELWAVLNCRGRWRLWRRGCSGI